LNYRASGATRGGRSRHLWLLAERSVPSRGSRKEPIGMLKRLISTMCVGACALAVGLGAVGCEEKGALERAGRQADKVGSAIGDAAKRTHEAVAGAAKEAREAVKDATGH
jgi:hypothetical protein